MEIDKFSSIMQSKGYDSYVFTNGGYPGKLKDSINDFLKNEGKPSNNQLSLSGYLKWDGEDKPRVEFRMNLKLNNDKIELDKMEVSKVDQFGKLVKNHVFNNLMTITAPSADEAINKVIESKEKISSKKNYSF